MLFRSCLALIVLAVDVDVSIAATGPISCTESCKIRVANMIKMSEKLYRDSRGMWLLNINDSDDLVFLPLQRTGRLADRAAQSVGSLTAMS